MGFLHHANYFAYFEIGRTELLRASGGNYRRMEEEGQLVVVVKAECLATAHVILAVVDIVVARDDQSRLPGSGRCG